MVEDFLILRIGSFKMNIRFLEKLNEEETEKGYISFWSGGRIKYSFEIIYEDNEDVELFENELKLNLGQLGLENIHKI